MTKEITFRIADSGQIYPVMMQAQEMVGKGLPAGEVEIAIRRPHQKRSLDQNRLMWKLLNDISKQVEWCGQYHDAETWKDLITALMKKQTLLPGLDGGFVAIGTSTRKLRKAEFSDLIECIYSVGAERNVQWSADTSVDWDSYKEARAA